MTFLINCRIRRPLLVLMLLFWTSFVLLSTAPFTSSACATPVVKYKRIVPIKASQQIFKNLTNVLDKLAAKLTEKKDFKLEIYMKMLDQKNRMFYAFHGNLSMPWLKIMDKTANKTDANDTTWRIETTGDINVDLFVRKVKTVGNRAYFTFEGDILILLDSLVIHLATAVAEVAASAAIDYVAKNLITVLQGLQGNKLGEAVYHSMKDLSAISVGKASDSTIHRMIGFENSNPLISTLVRNVKNGNFFSFILFNVITIGVHQGMKIAGTTLGAVVGTSLFPGAGSIVGALIGRVGSMIIVKFVINKVAVEWYMQLQLKRLVKLARSDLTAGTASRAKYEKLTASIYSKIHDEIIKDKFKKFDVLKSFLSKNGKKEILAMKPLLSDIVKTLQHMVLQQKDWAGARKYYQLREVIKTKKVNPQLFGY